MPRTGLVHEMRGAVELAARRSVEDAIFHLASGVKKAAPMVVDEIGEEIASSRVGQGNKVWRKGLGATI